MDGMTSKTQAALLENAERYYDLLITKGVSPEVAADRVWDCYTRAFGENDKPLADPHDRLFENQLQAIVQKGIDNA